MGEQFKRGIIVTCANCMIEESVVSNTIRDAKVKLEENYGWGKTKEGWVCSECIEE